MKKTISDIEIELVQGNIVKQDDVTAIVNAANAQLQPGGGVAGAIHRAAGPMLREESEPLGPIKPGEAVITSAFELPNQYVIHCLGPVYGVNKPEDKLLADCYRNALRIADEEKIESIAFPSISTGAFGYPLEKASEIALKTIKENAETLKNVKTIRIVLFSENDYEVYKRKMSEIF